MTYTSKEQDDTMTGAPRLLTPEEIGLMVKVYRDVYGWTQETLADLSGLQRRAIQRVE